MKPRIAICIALALVLSAAPAWAGQPLGSNPGVTPASPARDRRHEEQRLLAQARQALQVGDLATARRNAALAELLNVPVDQATAAFEDSPAKLRAEIARVESRPPAPGGAFNPGNTYPPQAAPPGGSFNPGGNTYAANPAQGYPPSQPEPAYGGESPRMFPSTEGNAPGNLRPGGQTPGSYSPAPTAPQNLSPEMQQRRDQALRFSAQARLAMDQGDFILADRLVKQALSLQVPGELFGPDSHPELLAIQIERELSRRSVIRAGFDQGNPNGSQVTPGVYRPENDPTRVVPAAGEGGPRPLPGFGQPNQADALRAMQAGMKAMQSGDRETALKHYTEAWKNAHQLDPLTRQSLQEQLNALQASASSDRVQSSAPMNLQRAASEQEVLRQQLFRKIGQERAAAQEMREKRPREGLARLQKVREEVAQANLEPADQKNMLYAIDRTITEMETYISRNKPQIEQDEHARDVMSNVEADRMHRVERQNKLAELVERFNQLMREERYAEAVVIAKQARELDPQAAVVENMVWQSTFAYRIASQMSIRESNEENFFMTLQSVEASAIPFDDRNPYSLGDARRWEDLTKRRLDALKRESTRYSPAELKIQRSLSNMVDVDFTNRPLGEVAAMLGEIGQVNIYLDPQGLAAEGVTTATPVTINLRQPVSLESALNLILQPLQLSFVIQNEVLRITSEQTRKTDVHPVVYYVADLVVPIPNFTPSYNMGVPSALQAAYQTAGFNQAQTLGGGGSVPLTIASQQAPTNTSASVLAQMSSGGGLSFRGQPTQQLGPGPGGMGGGPQADFDSLIELITSTISPDSWDEVGGPGSLQGFDTNLSLVVSQTQEVHEAIADLLEQLRRLQDLQVTIEVRFITLNDNFFERIGIDFDFDIDDNNTIQPSTLDDNGPSISFGLGPDGQPTADLDLQFTQGGFSTAVPQFGGFDAATAANVGFAILSDIEVFFLLQASQGDQRSNVMQAPKVTLFNGQQANISDTSQTPFVTSVVPVVGDFAAAHQPVVMVLSEGMSLSVQAVVSNDKRFVRLTLVPFFSSIGDVQEFTFTGKTSTSTGEAVIGSDGNVLTRDGVTVTTEGTTVQLPQFNFTTVTTTVSVPDGGTVLMGGIKRLSEGRNESGVPLLSKLPYINRLFKNVGIGRTTQSLMMMVTPRIIIQEEEEERTVGRPLTNP
ncbi:general secretion pathway protein GspD [Lignipirellula cremea]|uniref:general secretion pathway protein GspD n=1 Tax=Lignipirellula cremea TaxID=2528010 RepID=UPI0018D2486C|nr:general secretion pathway protein GspD [Lignipirellula cremea]